MRLGGAEGPLPSTGTKRPPAERADSDLPGRRALGANPPGAGARRPDARAGDRDRAVGGRRARSAFATYRRQPRRSHRRKSRSGQRARARRRQGRAAASAPATVLDVLNAEQELLNSQVALVTARRDAICRRLPACSTQWARPRRRTSGWTAARSTIRSAITAGSPADWSDWSSDPRHAPVATRTVTPSESQPLPTPHDQ
jgi:outer membrane protein